MIKTENKPPFSVFSDPLLVARFMSKSRCDPTTGCWLWLRSRDKDGYGKFQIPKTDVNGTFIGQWHVRAHQYALALKLGRWPRGVARHSCNNPSCVNGDHLIEGSQKDNIDDCLRQGRKARGDRHGKMKLTDAQVAEIRLRSLAGESCRALAAAYGVHRAHVHGIISGRLRPAR